MNRGLARWILAGLFLLALAFRLLIAASAPAPGFDAYFTLRVVDHIVETGRPLIDDPLGFGGRTLRYSPIYYYALAPFRAFLDPAIFMMIVPNAMAAAIVFALYRLSLRLSGSPLAGLFVAALGALNPFFLHKGLVGEGAALAVPVMVFALDAFLGAGSGGGLGRTIAMLVALVVLSPISLVLIGGFLLYLFLLRLEGLAVERREMELALFGGLFALWFHVVLYKSALRAQGLHVLWMNIPRSLLDQQFAALDVVQVVSALGVLVVSLGTIGLYRSVVGRRRAAALLFGLVLAVTILVGARLLAFTTGMLWLGLLLACFAGDALHSLYHYLRQTKAPVLAGPIVAALAAIALLGAALGAIEVASAFPAAAPEEAELAAMRWLDQSTPLDAKIWAPVEEGHFVAYAAHRKTAYDLWFFGVAGGTQVYEDLRDLSRTPFEVEAVAGLHRRRITHIYVPPRDVAQGARPAFLDSPCFALRYRAAVEVYEVRCRPT